MESLRAAPCAELSATARLMRMCGLGAALVEEKEAILRDALMLRDLLHCNQPYLSLAQGSAAWHAARSGRLTASVFATAAGLSSFATARHLWQYRTGRVGDGERWEGNEHTARGTLLEPLACQHYTRLTGNAVQPCGLFLHPTHSWLAASPDGLIGSDGLLEIKCPAHKPHDTLPPLYMAQVQGQLFIAGREWAHFFSFCARAAGDEGQQQQQPVAALFEVRRNEAYWAWLLQRLQRFYACEQADIDPGDDLCLRPGEAPPHVDVACVGRWQ